MSSFYYNQEHSITFGDKNTWEDWHLIPSVRPSFAPPLPKINLIEIPGASGSIDLSDSLTGYVLYQDRTGSFEFIVSDQETPWEDIKSEILNYLQGKRFKAILEDDKYFYYEGRFWVNEDRSDPGYSSIVIEYQVYPYKQERNSSIEDWLWDPFDFKYGIIRFFKDLEIDGSLKVVLPKTEEPVSPKIIASVFDQGEGLKVKYDKTTYTLNNGINLIPPIMVYNSEVTLEFSGYGIVSIDYRGGRL